MREFNFIKKCVGSSTLTSVMVGAALLLGSSAYAQVKGNSQNKMDILCPVPLDPTEHKEACKLIEAEPKKYKGEFGCHLNIYDSVTRVIQSWKGILEGKVETVSDADIKDNALRCEYKGTGMEGKVNYLTTLPPSTAWGCLPNEKKNGFTCYKMEGKGKSPAKSKQ